MQDDDALINEITTLMRQGEALIDKANMKMAEYYLERAEQGSANAQYRIGRRYRYGRGVRQDFAKASYWYRMATKQGHLQAGVELCGLYVDRFFDFFRP